MTDINELGQKRQALENRLQDLSEPLISGLAEARELEEAVKAEGRSVAILIKDMETMLRKLGIESAPPQQRQRRSSPAPRKAPEERVQQAYKVVQANNGPMTAREVGEAMGVSMVVARQALASGRESTPERSALIRLVGTRRERASGSPTQVYDVFEEREA